MTLTSKHFLAIILFAAALLRLVNLGGGDLTGSDEIFYAFKSVGMVDFDNSPAQPSIWELIEKNGEAVPAWARLSFSDHPPLVFLVQNFFMKIFGENNFAFRLPSALLGIISVYLIYLIGRRLFSENIGLIAAAIYATTLNGVFISRLALQEGYVIFFLLLASYFFIRVLSDGKFFIWTGATLGLGMLVKYNVFILAPIFLSYLFIFRRDVFRNKRFWLAIGLAVLISSPIIIYNYNLYKTFGHFDFQISYILGQNPEVWQSAPGKEEIGSLTDRLANFIPNFYKTNSWGFASFFLLAAIAGVFRWARRPKNPDPKTALLGISIFWLILLLLIIGPTNRFLAMLTPFATLSVSSFLLFIYSRFLAGKEKLALGILGAFLIAATLYSINSAVMNYPVGARFWMWSEARFDNYHWGYNQLEQYIEKELSGKRPAISLNLPYQFLQEAADRGLAKSKISGLKPSPTLIVYDNNIHGAPQLWSFDRRQIYHGWPILKIEDYSRLLAEQGANFLDKAGFQDYYFIIAAENVPWKKDSADYGFRFEQQLLSRGFSPESIKNERGEEVFRVYKL